MSDRIREILIWHRSENPGVLTNLSGLLNHKRLGGRGYKIRIYKGEVPLRREN